MISEEQLNQFRVEGTSVRVVRDGMEANDVLGIVVAWDADSVVIRKRSRRVVKLSRSYVYEPVTAPRTEL
ncbi:MULTISPECIES: hypothetical protein [Paenibacillus]|uniref:Uncharacterized protein n=1 Tax=Paenibacillus lignilyticus TaxID=1172615 RepID=A0ABS5C5I2_9BACL|nr:MULTISPECIES: hypothetical protein [Paenibacillus]MBP3961256.1 hypothetical protein [Paenibacillus lignilyticus]SFS60198.1 hypothetical protein SAMN05428962_1315 [Paenibacillus sp. BC26]